MLAGARSYPNDPAQWYRKIFLFSRKSRDNLSWSHHIVPDDPQGVGSDHLCVARSRNAQETRRLLRRMVAQMH